VNEKVKDTAVVKTISLPDNLWEVVDNHSTEWQTNRSAALRRIILEWQKGQAPLPAQASTKIHRIAA
jgi:metal-responsive CopG/Arc/MetJ family transcriptional regulator